MTANLNTYTEISCNDVRDVYGNCTLKLKIEFKAYKVWICLSKEFKLASVCVREHDLIITKFIMGTFIYTKHVCIYGL